MPVPARVLTAAMATMVAGAAIAQPAKLNPGYHDPDLLGAKHGAMHDALLRGLAGGTVQTLPSWSRPFTVAGQSYSYTLLGTDPNAGAATTIVPTILVPIRLTVPDTMVNGAPLVLDATPTMQSVLHSPIFTAASFDTGHLQFADAMLHAEFPHAPSGWHLILSPSVAPPLDVTLPVGGTQVMQSRSGKYLAIVNGHGIDGAIAAALRRNYSASTYVIFFTYNALDAGAFGYHSNYLHQNGAENTVFTYTSWLENVNDLFQIPSPDADTLAHEVAEVVHDAFGTSLTREWGDWFGKNRCFQNYIETGDAVEDATAKVQNYRQKVSVNGKMLTYTLQTEAMLQWFTRTYPSDAIHQAYSFPGETVLLGPAPLTCRK